MKKLVILLAVLIATPVFALTVAMTDNGDDTVTIGYTGANPDDLPFLWAARALICSLVVIGIILVAVVSKRWQRTPDAQNGY